MYIHICMYIYRNRVVPKDRKRNTNHDLSSGDPKQLQAKDPSDA